MPYRLQASLSDVLRGARKATALRVYRPRRAFAGCLLAVPIKRGQP